MKKRTVRIPAKRPSKRVSNSTTLPKKKVLPAKVSNRSPNDPAGREHNLTKQALIFVDEAASQIRAGIRKGSGSMAKSNSEAKNKSHELIGKASTTLLMAIEEGTSALQNLIKKI